MRSIGDALLRRWLRMLGLSRHSPASWYRNRVREELRERRTAVTGLQKLSETSDVSFSIARARHDDFLVGRLPPFVASTHMLVCAYMMAKYTMRWKFYCTAAMLCRAPQSHLVREVVNPGKDFKLGEVASRYKIDRDKFERVGRQLRWIWPLFP